jgi:hypothetical protein
VEVAGDICLRRPRRTQGCGADDDDDDDDDDILILKFLDCKLEDKRFCTEWLQAFPDFNLLLISS